LNIHRKMKARCFAKPLYGLTPVPRVRIPPSPPDFLLSSIQHRLRAPGRHFQLQSQIRRQFSEGNNHGCRPRPYDDARSARIPRLWLLRPIPRRPWFASKLPAITAAWELSGAGLTMSSASRARAVDQRGPSGSQQGELHLVHDGGATRQLEHPGYCGQAA
jgi:hypothetical protein